MNIREIKENKKQYLSLLLLADEQEDMIDRYIDRGTMYVLDDDGVKCECVVTDEGEGILEIKNIATEPQYQGKGYARYLVEAAKKYAEKERVPLLFDTDMERYAQIYQHYGCVLYNQTSASNGVTRYNLVWTKDK